MNRNKIINIIYFFGIMKNNQKILNVSPDYIIEKSMIFFNNLGNKSYITNIRTQKIWKSYCKRWKVEEDNYEILNIINFIEMSNFSNLKGVIANFKMFMFDFDSVSDDDLSYKIHPILRNSLNRSISNNRYLKLFALQ